MDKIVLFVLVIMLALIGVMLYQMYTAPQEPEDERRPFSMRPTMSQLAFINDLYNRLDVPYSKRSKPEDAAEASQLINQLREELEEKRNQEEVA